MGRGKIGERREAELRDVGAEERRAAAVIDKQSSLLQQLQRASRNGGGGAVLQISLSPLGNTPGVALPSIVAPRDLCARSFAELVAQFGI